MLLYVCVSVAIPSLLFAILCLISPSLGKGNKPYGRLCYPDHFYFGFQNRAVTLNCTDQTNLKVIIHPRLCIGEARGNVLLNPLPSQITRQSP